MSIYIGDFDKTTSMFFLIKDEKFLEKDIEIWRKVSSIISKEFNCGSMHNKKYLNAKKN